jgi:ATP-binding cassette subfamily B protein
MKTSTIFSFFWKQIKPYRWFYIVMLIPPVLSSLYPFLYNYSIKLLLDIVAGQQHPSYSQLLFPVSLFLGTKLGLELVWRINHMASWKSLPYVRRSLWLQIYDYVQHHSYKYFQNNFTGSITGKIKGIVNGYDKVWSELHHGLGLVALKIIINLSVLMVVNLQLGIFLFSWGVIFLSAMYKMSKKLDHYAFQEAESQHKIVGQLSDRIMNVISIFAFAAQKRELSLLNDSISNDLIPKQVRASQYDFKMQVVGGLFYFLKFCFILLYAIHLKTKGLVSVGDFAFVLGLTLSLSEEIWQLVVSFQDFLRDMSDLKSAFAILYVPQEQLDGPHAAPLVIRSPKIEFKNIALSYDNKSHIFKNFNLTIQAGEKVGLVGHSGAGKSSLINLLMRYFSCSGGEICIDGQDISTVSQETLRRQIAIIPQDTMLFHRTILDNIRYGRPEATEEEVIEAAKKAYIHDFIMQLPEQYQTYAGERGIKLSGGQRQRIAIARAILKIASKDAPILLLDEATSALDSETELLIQKSLHMLISNQQQTVVAIAHRLSTLKHMDRIVVLDKGIIMEQGTHAELLEKSNSLYSTLWHLQEVI